MFHAIDMLSVGLTSLHMAPYQGPSIDEFYPSDVLFVGTPFALNRILLIRLFAVLALCFVVWLGVRNMKIVPGRAQGVLEFFLRFVRVNIAEETLGKKEGERFLPLLSTIFFTILAMNITGIIPGLNIASTALIGVPLILGIVSWFSFIYVGVKKQGGWHYLVHTLFPSGVPVPLYILITPIEIISTFVFRPLTLALRLTMNMFVGHILLVLCFGVTSWFFFEAGGLWRFMGLGTLLFGFIFTLFEMFIIALQTYIFTLLAASYIQLSLAEDH